MATCLLSLARGGCNDASSVGSLSLASTGSYMTGSLSRLFHLRSPPVPLGSSSGWLFAPSPNKPSAVDLPPSLLRHGSLSVAFTPQLPRDARFCHAPCQSVL